MAHIVVPVRDHLNGLPASFQLANHLVAYPALERQVAATMSGRLLVSAPVAPPSALGDLTFTVDCVKKLLA